MLPRDETRMDEHQPQNRLVTSIRFAQEIVMSSPSQVRLHPSPRYTLLRLPLFAPPSSVFAEAVIILLLLLLRQTFSCGV